MKKSKIVIGLVGLALFGTACTSSKEAKDGGSNAASEQKAVSTGFNRLADSQPIPSFDYSQERQTLIDVETVRATGVVTTTAGYLEGVGLIWWCPSVGAPVPSTYQLSASQQWVDLPGDHTESYVNVDQGEPTGSYIGSSSGTWTLCTDNNGKKFAKYWEGYVDSTVGIVSSYPAEKRIQITSSTYDFKEKK